MGLFLLLIKPHVLGWLGDFCGWIDLSKVSKFSWLWWRDSLREFGKSGKLIWLEDWSSKTKDPFYDPYITNKTRGHARPGHNLFWIARVGIRFFWNPKFHFRNSWIFEERWEFLSHFLYLDILFIVRIFLGLLQGFSLLFYFLGYRIFNFFVIMACLWFFRLCEKKTFGVGRMRNPTKNSYFGWL